MNHDELYINKIHVRFLITGSVFLSENYVQRKENIQEEYAYIKCVCKRTHDHEQLTCKLASL